MNGLKSNRRSGRRCRGEERGILSARVRPGQDVSIIDVSPGGVLVESGQRLLPGAVVELQIQLPTHRATVRGRVLRCVVARLRPAFVCYRGAIGFDRRLPLFAETSLDGYELPAREVEEIRVPRARSTHGVI